MSVKHVLTKEIGNLRGFSTDSIFLRPANVADIAINLQKSPEETLQLRRGFQCQIAKIGGMGIGTFNDPISDVIQTVTIGTDGFLYQKLDKQIYFNYNGQVTGVITNVATASNATVTSAAHGLQSGAILIIRNLVGMNDLNNKTFIIIVTGVNTFNPYYTTNSGVTIRTGAINSASQSNPCVINSIAHGRTTGDQIMIAGVQGMTNLNNLAYTINVLDPDNFELNGVDSTGFPAYTSGGSWYLAVNSTTFPAYVSGGTWSISFADNRYLSFTIFTDPRYLSTNPGWSVAPWSFSPWGAPSGESITANITVNRAAQIDANAINVNTVSVAFGHELVATDIIQFNASNGVFNQRVVLSVTPTSVTFDGFPVSVLAGVYLNQFFDIPFRRGFDVSSPYLISTFIATITNLTTGVHGLLVDVNGDTNYPAAFLQIFEPMIVDSNSTFTIDYWYWDMVNSTDSPPFTGPPFPGSANVKFQNSPTFENASFAAFDDVLYIANGFDFPQKFDGQTVYRTGMPLGIRPPTVVDQPAALSMPFLNTQKYEYAITYEQIDARGHIVEGEISPVRLHTDMTTPSAMDVTITNLSSSVGNNWNTDGAIATAGTATVYGPDSKGFYYDLVGLTPGFTLKIGDNAYYADQTCAVMTAAGTSNTIPVLAGHGVVAGDTVYLFDTGASRSIQRVVELVTTTSITVLGTEVTFNFASNPNIMCYKNSLVFGDVAIVDGTQNNLLNILVAAGHTVQLNDVVEFIDAQDNLQRRNVTFVDATHVTIDGNPVSVTDRFLISSISTRTNALNFQRLNANGITFKAHVALTDPYGSLNISNNLRINLYRTLANESFGVNGKLFLVAPIPNNSLGGIQVYTDGFIGVAGPPPVNELGREFDNPVLAPNPPPIAKYIKSYGNQMFYAGGERGNPEDSDRVFFSEGNEPEAVALDSSFFNVPNIDDDVTGIGIAGTTLVITKNQSLWAVTGNFLSDQGGVIQIAPGTNIGCVAHATIASVGTLMYFLHTNGVYAITENQLFPTDSFGNPVPLSLAINTLFRTTPFLPQTRFQFKRAVALNYPKDLQYLLFLPCEDKQTTIRDANAFSTILCYDYEGKNWFSWYNMNAAGGMVVIDDDLYFQERRFSAVDGNTANLYKQHRFYRLIDHADHASPERAEWRSSWEDLDQPEVRKKFCRCVLLLDRLSELYQYNNPEMFFSSYLNRIPNLQSTIAEIFQTDNIRNSSWSYSGWGWNFWSGYQDSFVTVNLKQGTVAKSIQVGFVIQGINMDISFAGFQLEAIPENRRSILR